MLMQVAKKKTGKEVWDCLKSRFVGADHVKEARLQTLKSEFNALRMKGLTIMLGNDGHVSQVQQLGRHVG